MLGSNTDNLDDLPCSGDSDSLITVECPSMRNRPIAISILTSESSVLNKGRRMERIHLSRTRPNWRPVVPESARGVSQA